MQSALFTNADHLAKHPSPNWIRRVKLRKSRVVCILCFLPDAMILSAVKHSIDFSALLEQSEQV